MGDAGFQDDPNDVTDTTSLEDLAAAVRQQESSSTGTASPRRLGTGSRLLIIVMQIWAALLMGAGLIVAILTIVELGLGSPMLEKVSQTDTAMTYRGWGIGAAAAITLLVLAAIQNHFAARLRRRRMAR